VSLQFPIHYQKPLPGSDFGNPPYKGVLAFQAMMNLLFRILSRFSPYIPSFAPEFHHNSTRKKRGQTSLLHLPNERRRQRVSTLCTKGSAPLYLKGSPPFVRKGHHPLSQRVTTLCAKGSAPFRRKGQHPFVRCLVRGCSLSREEVPLASLPTPFRLVEKDPVLEDACRERMVTRWDEAKSSKGAFTLVGNL